MRSYHVPVGVHVDAETAEEALEIVESALLGIDSWNDLADLEDVRIHTVTIGNLDEIKDDGEAVLGHEEDAHICLVCKSVTPNEEPCWNCGHDEQNDPLTPDAYGQKDTLPSFAESGMSILDWLAAEEEETWGRG